MTAPTLSPVRWWRDDATRYDDRPLIGICRSWTQSTLEWAYELARPDPKLERCFAWLAEKQTEFWRSMMLPAELLHAPSPGGMSGSGEALAEYRRRIGVTDDVR